ncbi:hypothetical protein QFC21_006179 [Naganishia friedmannii]|uniref:Uncharacterized protein n=1 Tax=Naganishia friedmannii TaxID=89922 RepID=A0ACC2V4P8_9TREE|nr:hypothetical protein QFC21_006179 [Naganishia friedmannii]
MRIFTTSLLGLAGTFPSRSGRKGFPAYFLLTLTILSPLRVGLATLVSATPIRIVAIEAVAPLHPEVIDVGYITHSPNSHKPASSNGNGLAPGWLKEFMDKYAPATVEANERGGFKWTTTSAAVAHPHPYPHEGPFDHSLSADTDASLIPEWMYAPPLGSPSSLGEVAGMGEVDGEMMLVTRPDGVVVYEFVPAVKAQGGAGCVFHSFVKMVKSLNTHELVIFIISTTLMLLVILRLAFLIALLIHRAHLWANECPGEAAARRRRHLAREAEMGGGAVGAGRIEEVRKFEEDVDPVPAYTVDGEELDEKDVLLPAYEEHARM